MMESALPSLQWERFMFILLSDSKIRMGLIYFDAISTVYKLSMDIFHLYVLEMRSKWWLPCEAVYLLMHFPSAEPTLQGKLLSICMRVLRPLWTNGVNSMSDLCGHYSVSSCTQLCGLWKLIKASITPRFVHVRIWNLINRTLYSSNISERGTEILQKYCFVFCLYLAKPIAKNRKLNNYLSNKLLFPSTEKAEIFTYSW